MIVRTLARVVWAAAVGAALHVASAPRRFAFRGASRGPWRRGGGGACLATVVDESIENSVSELAEVIADLGAADLNVRDAASALSARAARGARKPPPRVPLS